MAQASTTNFATSKAGVSGLLRSRAAQSQKTDAYLQEAFEDLKGLMTHAKDMVELARRFSAQETSANNESDTSIISFRQDMCMNLGIQNPISKQQTGDKYHTQLAYQLETFLVPVLRKANQEQKEAVESNVTVSGKGGIISLVDVYCMYNRALGTELISPEDLFEAVSLFRPLRLSLELRKFPSGVLFIQLKSSSEDEVVKKLREMAEKSAPISALAVSQSLEISVALAKERLWTAEAKGELCRDVSSEGVLYYPNRFLPEST